MSLDPMYSHHRSPSSPTGAQVSRGAYRRHELPGIRDLLGADMRTPSSNAPLNDTGLELGFSNLPHSASLPRMHAESWNSSPIRPSVITPRRMYRHSHSARSEPQGIASFTSGSSFTSLHAFMHRMQVADELHESPISDDLVQRRKRRSLDTQSTQWSPTSTGLAPGIERKPFRHVSSSAQHPRMPRRERSAFASYVFPSAEMRESRIVKSKQECQGAGPPIPEPLLFGSNTTIPPVSDRSHPMTDPPRSLSRSQSSYSISGASEGCPTTPGVELTEFPLNLHEEHEKMSVASMLISQPQDDETKQSPGRGRSSSIQLTQNSPHSTVPVTASDSPNWQAPKQVKSSSAGAAGKFECSCTGAMPGNSALEQYNLVVTTMGGLDASSFMPASKTTQGTYMHGRRQQTVATVVETSTISSPGRQESSTSFVTSTAPTPTPTITPAPPQQQTAVAPVAGGVVGGVVGLLLLLAILFLLIRRSRNRRATRALDSAFAEAGVGGGGVDRRARTRPAHAEDAWLPMSHSDLNAGNIRESHSDGALSLRPADTYYASPIHPSYMQEADMGTSMSGPDMSTGLPVSTSYRSDKDATTGAQAMNSLRDESLYQPASVPMDSSVASQLRAANNASFPPTQQEDYQGENSVASFQRSGAATVNQMPPVSSNTYPETPYLHSTIQEPREETVLNMQPNNPESLGNLQESYVPSTPPTAAAPAITDSTLSRVQSNSSPSRPQLAHIATNANGLDDNTVEAQSPSSAYMWLPSRRYEGSETDPISRGNTILSRNSMIFSELPRPESAEEQELSNKLWRTTGPLRVANEP
ncbi:hypothetical protein MPSI1_000729 [Malassezia psittaci]|uniref:Uncharacterized protein n=1 Tax=Malassezia psittaci TaxID=1821823 RepID=A0AAF0JIY1_9BASI|nr:hypothetical protein MPSI1_000729 [Malassezia psittaci]